MTVVQFTPPPNDRDMIFICECGCASWELRGDGVLLCRACQEECSEAGAWHTPPKSKTTDDPPFFDDGGNGCGDFARRLALRKADEAVAIISAAECGRVSVWSGAVETQEQMGWLRRRVADALDLLEKGLPR